MSLKKKIKMKKYFPVLIILFSVILFSSCKEKKKVRKDLDSYNETLIRINKYLVKEDAERIKSYIARKKWDMQQTETGLWYEIYEKGDETGELAVEGNIVTINFRIELLDGTLCYTSDSIGAKKFKIAFSDVESGLNEGMKMLRTGDKARLIMPPYIAHGLLGDEYKIPARSIIFYDIEVLDIQK